MAKNKRRIALHAILFAQLVIGYVIYSSPNLILYSVILFTFVFIITMLYFSRSGSEGLKTSRLSHEMTDRVITYFIVGFIVQLLLLITASIFNLPVLRLISLVIFLQILYLLSLIVPVVDAGLLWSSLKRNTPT